MIYHLERRSTISLWVFLRFLGFLRSMDQTWNDTKFWCSAFGESRCFTVVERFGKKIPLEKSHAHQRVLVFARPKTTSIYVWDPSRKIHGWSKKGSQKTLLVEGKKNNCGPQGFSFWPMATYLRPSKRLQGVQRRGKQLICRESLGENSLVGFLSLFECLFWLKQWMCTFAVYLGASTFLCFSGAFRLGQCKLNGVFTFLLAGRQISLGGFMRSSSAEGSKWAERVRKQAGVCDTPQKMPKDLRNGTNHIEITFGAIHLCQLSPYLSNHSDHSAFLETSEVKRLFAALVHWVPSTMLNAENKTFPIDLLEINDMVLSLGQD